MVPWLLVEADAVDGIQLTSWPSLRTDIENAGGEWGRRSLRSAMASSSRPANPTTFPSSADRWWSSSARTTTRIDPLRARACRAGVLPRTRGACLDFRSRLRAAVHRAGPLDPSPSPAPSGRVAWTAEAVVPGIAQHLQRKVDRLPDLPAQRHVPQPKGVERIADVGVHPERPLVRHGQPEAERDGAGAGTVCSIGTSPASQQDKPRFQALKHHSMSMTSMKKSALNRPVSRSSRKLNRGAPTSARSRPG